MALKSIVAYILAFEKQISSLFLKKNFVFICVYAIFFVILHANLRYYAIL